MDKSHSLQTRNTTKQSTKGGNRQDTLTKAKEKHI